MRLFAAEVLPELLKHDSALVHLPGNLSAIHWSFARLIEYASRGTELRTGDIIGSGTVGTGCILELSGTHGSDA